MPACAPVRLIAATPFASSAIDSSVLETISPVESSTSISRGLGFVLIWRANSIRSSVVSPIAETVTTTSSPARRRTAMRRATCWIFSAVATEDPPYFCTMRLMR